MRTTQLVQLKKVDEALTLLREGTYREEPKKSEIERPGESPKVKLPPIVGSYILQVVERVDGSMETKLLDSDGGEPKVPVIFVLTKPELNVAMQRCAVRAEKEGGRFDARDQDSIAREVVAMRLEGVDSWSEYKKLQRLSRKNAESRASTGRPVAVNGPSGEITATTPVGGGRSQRRRAAALARRASRVVAAVNEKSVEQQKEFLADVLDKVQVAPEDRVRLDALRESLRSTAMDAMDAEFEKSGGGG